MDLLNTIVLWIGRLAVLGVSIGLVIRIARYIGGL